MGYLILGVEGDNSSVEFQALAPNDAIQVVPGQGPESVPQLELMRAWMYLVGKRPSAASDIAAVGADSTKLVLHVIDPSAGDHGRVRFIMLEGTAAHVSRLDGTDVHSMSSAPTYIDAWRNSAGGLDRIDDAEPFDADTTPGSEGLVAVIDAVRTELGVP